MDTFLKSFLIPGVFKIQNGIFVKKLNRTRLFYYNSDISGQWVIKGYVLVWIFTRFAS